jgi:hypothetical protein
MTNTSGRAPKNGTTVDNVFYAGGQYLPSDGVAKRGMFNRYYTEAQTNESKRKQNETRARYYMNEAFKHYTNGDDGAGNYNATMAQTHFRRAAYFASK